MNAGAEGIASEARLSAGSIFHPPQQVARSFLVALADAWIPPTGGIAPDGFLPRHSCRGRPTSGSISAEEY
jgi:hypothetical protein